MKQEEMYTKNAILNYDKYSNKKDLINSLLENDKMYSLKEVEKIIENYLKGVVK